MKVIYNPSMQQEPFNHPTRLLPPRQEKTILLWLENAGRFSASDVEEPPVGLSDHLVDEIIDADAYQEEDAETEDEEF